MDERPVLRDGQPVRASQGEGLGRRGARWGRAADALCGRVWRTGPAQDREAAAADAARRPCARLRRSRRSPADPGCLADGAENPYFARSITNRVWASYFGVGLVEKVDDMRVSNPASNDALLAAAADYLVRHKFDLKALMRAILQSNAYQRSSRPLPGNHLEHRFYSRYYPRRMMAEVLHDAIVQVTGVPTRFDFIAFPGATGRKPSSTRWELAPSSSTTPRSRTTSSRRSAAIPAESSATASGRTNRQWFRCCTFPTAPR